MAAAVILGILIIINLAGIRQPLSYFLLGSLLWFVLLKSGLHCLTRLLHQHHHYVHTVPFCVVYDESKARVLKVALKQLPSQSEKVKILRDTIFKALKAGYSCSKSNQN